MHQNLVPVLYCMVLCLQAISISTSSSHASLSPVDSFGKHESLLPMTYTEQSSAQFISSPSNVDASLNNENLSEYILQNYYDDIQKRSDHEQIEYEDDQNSKLEHVKEGNNYYDRADVTSLYSNWKALVERYPHDDNQTESFQDYDQEDEQMSGQYSVAENGDQRQGLEEIHNRHFQPETPLNTDQYLSDEQNWPSGDEISKRADTSANQLVYTDFNRPNEEGIPLGSNGKTTFGKKSKKSKKSKKLQIVYIKVPLLNLMDKSQATVSTSMEDDSEENMSESQSSETQFDSSAEVQSSTVSSSPATAASTTTMTTIATTATSNYSTISPLDHFYPLNQTQLQLLSSQFYSTWLPTNQPSASLALLQTLSNSNFTKTLLPMLQQAKQAEQQKQSQFQLHSNQTNSPTEQPVTGGGEEFPMTSSDKIHRKSTWNVDDIETKEKNSANENFSEQKHKTSYYYYYYPPNPEQSSMNLNYSNDFSETNTRSRNTANSHHHRNSANNGDPSSIHYQAESSQHSPTKFRSNFPSYFSNSFSSFSHKDRANNSNSHGSSLGGNSWLNTKPQSIALLSGQNSTLNREGKKLGILPIVIQINRDKNKTLTSSGNNGDSKSKSNSVTQSPWHGKQVDQKWSVNLSKPFKPLNNEHRTKLSNHGRRQSRFRSVFDDDYKSFEKPSKHTTSSQKSNRQTNSQSLFHKQPDFKFSSFDTKFSSNSHFSKPNGQFSNFFTGFDSNYPGGLMASNSKLNHHHHRNHPHHHHQQNQHQHHQSPQHHYNRGRGKIRAGIGNSEFMTPMASNFDTKNSILAKWNKKQLNDMGMDFDEVFFQNVPGMNYDSFLRMTQQYNDKMMHSADQSTSDNRLTFMLPERSIFAKLQRPKVYFGQPEILLPPLYPVTGTSDRSPRQHFSMADWDQAFWTGKKTNTVPTQTATPSSSGTKWQGANGRTGIPIGGKVSGHTSSGFTPVRSVEKRLKHYGLFGAGRL